MAAKASALRNPVWSSETSIDLELNHPVHGWIPFTASPDDPEAYGREIFKRAKSGKYGEVKGQDNGEA